MGSLEKYPYFEDKYLNDLKSYLLLLLGQAYIT